MRARRYEGCCPFCKVFKMTKEEHYGAYNLTEWYHCKKCGAYITKKEMATSFEA
jgi:hypothetical protein